MARAVVGAIAAFVLSVALPKIDSASAAVPSTVCRLERQVRIDPTTFLATVSTPVETYRFRDGKLYITSADHPEQFYDSVREVVFERRYVSGHQVFVFTIEPSGKQRLLMFHSDQLDIRVGEFSCGVDS